MTCAGWSLRSRRAGYFSICSVLYALKGAGWALTGSSIICFRIVKMKSGCCCSFFKIYVMLVVALVLVVDGAFFYPSSQVNAQSSLRVGGS